MLVRSQCSYGRNPRTIVILVRSQSSYGRNRKFDFANHDYFLMAVLQNIGGYKGYCGPRTGIRRALRTNSPHLLCTLDYQVPWITEYQVRSLILAQRHTRRASYLETANSNLNSNILPAEREEFEKPCFPVSMMTYVAEFGNVCQYLVYEQTSSQLYPP